VDSDHFEGDDEGKSKVRGGISNGKSTGSFDDYKMLLGKMQKALVQLALSKSLKLEAKRCSPFTGRVVHFGFVLHMKA
jgi:hypothetical protein